MEFRLLGPLEVVDGAAPLPIGPGKQRALLAILLLSANRTVARDRIVDDLWGHDVPESAQKMVQIHVSQLRRALPEPRVQTRPPGYLIEVDEDELDLARFDRLLRDGQRALADGDAATAASLLREALALWRGPALGEFAEPFAKYESARLEELRLAALESRIEADLALGDQRDVVGELETLVSQHPLRERLRSQQMLALYRSGRHAEALASYQAFRRTLADDLGIEPSASLRELQRRMLQQDPSLEPSSLADHRGALLAPAAGARTSGSAGDVAYARSGDTRIAYQVVGEGRVDIVLVHGLVCTFQPGWEHPKLAAFYERLASIGRLILFDKRGTGLSDRVSAERLPDLETRMDDVRAVLDAAGSERAALVGISEGGAMSTLFAATHPQRTSALTLIGTFPREMWAPDYPSGMREEDLRRRLDLLDEDDWATATTRHWLSHVAPGVLRDPAAVRWYASYVRRGASPGAYRAIRLMNAEIDIRDVLPAISVPTLVLYRAHEALREGSRFMGDHIPGALAVEMPGNEHLPWEGDSEPLLDELERFLSGVRDDVEPDRVLATLLVVDVVDASPQAGGAGDGAASDRFARYRLRAGAQLTRFHGRGLDTAGERLLASFDGPARAVRCACAIVASASEVGLKARAGVHAGEVERTAGRLRGGAVDAVIRIASSARPAEVLVSSTVKDIVAGSGISFDERGARELAGTPGVSRVFPAAG